MADKGGMMDLPMISDSVSGLEKSQSDLEALCRAMLSTITLEGNKEYFAGLPATWHELVKIWMDTFHVMATFHPTIQDAIYLATVWKTIRQQGYETVVQNGDPEGIDFVADRVFSLYEDLKPALAIQLGKEKAMSEVSFVSCKFHCTSMSKFANSNTLPGQPKFTFSYEFSAVYADSEENKVFFASIPSGNLKLFSVRDDLFEPGNNYYLDLEPTE